jgi:hypothetical protein
MAYAMMGGIIVGTLLTLLFLPALYVAWFRIQPVHGNPLSTHEPAEPLHEAPATEAISVANPSPALETQF